MIRRLRHRLRADRRGETAVEFALVGGMFFLLLLAPIEFGLMLWTGTSLQAVAAQTARCAAIGAAACSTSGAAQTYAVGLASNWISASAISTKDVSVQYGVNTCNNAAGTFDQVTITTSIWSGALISALGGAHQTARACFPTS